MVKETMIYLSQNTGSAWGLTTTISKKFPHNLCMFVDKVKKPYNLPAYLRGIVIVGSPENTIIPEQNYWDFLRAAEKAEVKVVGVLTRRDKRPSFPNNNEGLAKVINASEMKFTEISDELFEVFGVGYKP